jgi:hypothetical protein
VNSQGDVTGKGTLTMTLADATKINFTAEQEGNKTKLTFSPVHDIKLRKLGQLQIAAKLEKDFAERGFEGEVAVTLKLDKGMTFRVKHEHDPDDETTSVVLTVKF